MADASATAEGDFGRTPLAHLLVYVLDKRLTGALFIVAPGGLEHAVRIQRGVPVKVVPSDRYCLLGEMLVEAGAIDQATLEGALATKGLLGDMLLLAGRVDRDVLEGVAEQQFLKRMIRLFSLPPETTYRYYDGHAALQDYGSEPAAIDPIMLLWAGLRAHAECSALMEGTLAKLGDAPLRLHAQNTLVRFGLDENEAPLLECLQTQPTTLAQLADLEVVEMDLLDRFAYAMLITRQLDLGNGVTPLGAADLVSKEVAQSRASAVAQSRASVAKMQLKSTVHRVGAAAPDMPGDGERGRSVSRRSRDRSHDPNREAPPSSSRVDPPSSRTDGAPRPDSSSRGAEGPPTPRGEAPSSPEVPEAPPSGREPVPESGVVAVPSSSPPATPAPGPAPSSRPAAMPSRPPLAQVDDDMASLPPRELFQLALARLSSRDLPAALVACDLARCAAPDEPDFTVLSVWIRAQMAGADLKALCVELDEVLHDRERNVNARFYRAMLRKRLSDRAGAAQDFKKVLELAPGHAEAARELTALEGTPSGGVRPSLFGKIFNKG